MDTIYVQYANTKYLLANHMMELPLFKSLIEDTKENVFEFKQYEKEFEQLNNNTLIIETNCYYTYYNHLYDVFTYFTCDELLKKMQHIVYTLESDIIRCNMEVEFNILSENSQVWEFEYIMGHGLVTDKLLNKFLVNHYGVGNMLENTNISDEYIISIIHKFRIYECKYLTNRPLIVHEAYLKQVVLPYIRRISQSEIAHVLNYIIVTMDFIETYIIVTDIRNALNRFYTIQPLTEKFISKYANILNWRYISQMNLSEEFFTSHIVFTSIEQLSSNIYLPFDFFDKHIDKIDIESISKNKNITYEFAKKHLNILYKDLLSANTALPYSFILENAQILDINIVCKYHAIPCSFILEHIDKVTLYSVICNKNIPDEFIIEHLNKFKKTNRLIDINTIKSIYCFRSVKLLLICIEYIDVDVTVTDWFKSLPDQISKLLNIRKCRLIYFIHPNSTEEIIENCLIEYVICNTTNLLHGCLEVYNGMTLSFYKKYQRLVNIKILRNNSLKKELLLVNHKYKFKISY